MLTPTQFEAMTIRPAGAEDHGRLAELAALDSARPFAGDALVAEVEGRPIAAVEVGTGREIADPFAWTRSILDLLRIRAAQVR